MTSATGNNQEFATIEATDAARAYIGRIAGEMVSAYNISRSKAVARINQFWHGVSFLTEPQLTSLFHEDPGYWARVIFYQGKRLD